jgi:hypothetical protein
MAVESFRALTLMQHDVWRSVSADECRLKLTNDDDPHGLALELADGTTVRVAAEVRAAVAPAPEEERSLGQVALEAAAAAGAIVAVAVVAHCALRVVALTYGGK